MFTEKNSPNWFVVTGMTFFVVCGAASVKILATDLRRNETTIHNEVHQDINVDRRTDCKFLTFNCSGGK